MKMINKPVLAGFVAACWAVPFASASAQDSGASGAAPLEEIIVTTRRRQEDVQKVPIAIDVLTAARIDQLSITNVEDIARFNSSLTFDQGALPSDTRPVIRGVTANRGRPNVGILIDGVDVSSEALTVAGGGTMVNQRLLDLERVEVLKGPQNALYGRSAFTGAINYVTRRPGESFESEVRLEYDDYEQSDLRISMGGPLTDSFRARAIFSKYDSDGFYKNPNTGGNLGAADTIGGALSMEWDLSDTTSMFLRAAHSDESYTPPAERLVQSMSAVSSPANFLGTGTVTDDAVMMPHLNFGTAMCNGIDRTQPYYDSFGIPGAQPCRPIIVGELSATESQIDLSPDPRTGRDFLGSEKKTTQVNFELAKEFETGQFKYVLGYMDNNSHIQLDFDRTNSPIFSSFVPFPPPGMAVSQYGLSSMAEQHLDTTQWSHEFRLTGSSERTNWYIGMLHWQEEMNLQFDDEWWLREGGDPQAVLDILNASVFSFINEPIFPPFINNLCDAVYPGDPNCIPAVTTLQSSLGDTPAIPLNRETKHNSIAALITYDVTDTFAVTVEGRYLEERIYYEGEATDISFSGQFGGDPWWGNLFRNGPMTTNTVKETAFIPKVTLDWAANENMLLYGYFASAFKPGGVSTTDANGDVSDGEFKPEKLDVWEVGFKSNFRDRSIRWNGAAFFYDYTDQQVPFQFISPDTGVFQTSVVNAGKTEIKGLETDLVWNSVLLDGLSLQFGYTYTDAEFTDFNLSTILAEAGGTPSTFNRAKAGNEDADFTGNTPPLTAEHSATGSIRYGTTFSNGMGAYIEFLGQYQSERFVGEGNWATLPEYTQYDVFAGLSTDRWALTLFVRNLGDNDKPTSGLGNVDFNLLPDGMSLPQAHQVYLPNPRVTGARLQVFFGE